MHETEMKTVAYFDGGTSNAREFWNLVVLPDVKEFKSHPSYIRFGLKDELILQCPELGWLRDLADAAKHRGLGRGNVQVERVTNPSGRGGAGSLNVSAGGFGGGLFALGSGLASAQPR